MLSRVAVDAKKARGRARIEGHVEAVQPEAKPVADGFDERFLPRPAVEEAQRPVHGGKREVGLDFPSREELLCDRIGVGNRAHRFHIDADLATPREAERSDIGAMREVEPQAGPAQSGSKGRLAMRADNHFDRACRYPQPGSQQPPQRGPPEDESLAIALPNEPGRPLALGARKQG